jgi:DNA-binding XRE family transcriptional regulator
MKMTKKDKLQKDGWKFGSAKDFLDLSEEETAYIEMKLALSRYLKDRRRKNKLTQDQLAHAVHSSQSRIAKMEAGDPSVSMDLLVRSLLILGASPKQLARVIGSPVMNSI